MCRGSYIATNITGCIAIIVIGVIRGRSLITANRASFPVGIRVVCIRGTVGMRCGSCFATNITARIATVGVSVCYRSRVSTGITGFVTIVTVRM